MKDLTKTFMGYVVDNQDPTKAGRCRIRVFNLFDNIEDDLLPWAIPSGSANFSSNGQSTLSVPKIGTVVKVNFIGGSIYNPTYSAHSAMDDKMLEEISEDYIDSQVLMYDVANNVYAIFQPNRGFHINFKGSQILISPDGMITIAHNNNESVIQMQGDKLNIVSNGEIQIGGDSNAVVSIDANYVNIGGKDSTIIKGASGNEYAVNGKALFQLLGAMAKLIDAKLPSSPAVCELLVEGSKMAVLNRGIKYE